MPEYLFKMAVTVKIVLLPPLPGPGNGRHNSFKTNLAKFDRDEIAFYGFLPLAF